MQLMKVPDKLRSIISPKKKIRKLNSKEAYALWSQFYDQQPDNVVLYLEEKIFAELASEIDFNGKKILDYGCGTGRHWKNIYSRNPASITGADNSADMLKNLLQKYEDADTVLLDSGKEDLRENYDIILSTLTIGHIKKIEEVFDIWQNHLNKGGQILITDFHPEAFSKGMTRSFPFGNEIIEVENYEQRIDDLKKSFDMRGWEAQAFSERVIDDDVKFLFEKQNFMKAFEKYKGTPLIYGIVLVKS